MNLQLAGLGVTEIRRGCDARERVSVKRIERRADATATFTDKLDSRSRASASKDYPVILRAGLGPSRVSPGKVIISLRTASGTTFATAKTPEAHESKIDP